MTTAPDKGPQGSDPDTTITSSSGDAPDPPPMPIPANPHFSISIHGLVESARSDHGLRGASGAAAGGGDDYESYRRYCSRRLARLRRSRDVKKELSHGPAGGKSAGTSAAATSTAGAASAADEPKQQFTSKNKKKGKKGKGKGGGGSRQPSAATGGGGKKGGGKFAFHPRPHPDPHDATQHEHFCLVSLYSAERCWSRAMEIKAAYDEAVREAKRTAGKRKKKTKAGTLGGDEDGINDAGGSKKKASPAQIRRHYINKLHKASTYGTELEERAKVSCDDRTAIEARAYAAYMRGTLALEVGNWQVRTITFGMLAELVAFYYCCYIVNIESPDEWKSSSFVCVCVCSRPLAPNLVLL